MSIEYSAGIAYGYKLTQDEVASVRNYVCEEYSEDKWEELDEFLINLNSWGNGSDGYIFGTKVETVEDSCAIPVNDITESLEGDILTEIMLSYHHYIFPVLHHKSAKFWLFCQVY